jgi:hemerythrin
MAIQWTEDLSTGITEIDNQHKEMFSRINEFHQACKLGKGREKVRETIKFLEEYAIMHFSTEENYMKRYNYPDYDSHKIDHQNFMKIINNIKEDFEREGAGVALVVNINHMIVEWLHKHIRRVDKALAKFLRDKSRI